MRDTSASGLKALIARGNTTQVEIAADPDSDEISEALRTFAAGGGGLIVLGVRENGDSGAISPPRVHDTLEERAGVYRPDFVASVTQSLGWYVLASGVGRSKTFSGFEETDLHAIAADVESPRWRS